MRADTFLPAAFQRTALSYATFGELPSDFWMRRYARRHSGEINSPTTPSSHSGYAENPAFLQDQELVQSCERPLAFSNANARHAHPQTKDWPPDDADLREGRTTLEDKRGVELGCRIEHQ